MTSTEGARSFGRLLVAEVGDDGPSVGPPSAAGAYCAKLFADYGARVVTAGPGREGGPTGSGSDFYRTSKHHLSTPHGSEAARDLLARADVIIQSSSPDPIAHLVEPAGATQIVVRISPFATTGPYAHWKATDLVDAAIGGHLRLSGDPDREPLQGVPDIVCHAVGVAAFVGAVAALISLVRTGRGQLVETSHQEVLAALHQFTLLRYTHAGAVLQRHGNRYAGPGSAIGAYACADGWIGLALSQEDQVERMLEVTGLVAMLERDDVESVVHLMTDIELLNRELVPYLRAQGRDETVELFQALRLPCAPITDVDALPADEHLRARRFWHFDETLGVQLPGPPFRMSDHAWSPAPKPRTGALPVLSSAAGSGGNGPHLADGPLTGLRVIDMTRVWAGPLAARILADLGAEVVMTEVPWTRTGREVPQTFVDATRFFPDNEAGERPWNRSGFHNKYAINKASAVIELDKEQGRDLFASLVPRADVLVENYSPRVMPSFGFDADTIHQLNPDLVYVTMPGYGRSGPNTDWVAYGPTLDGHVGHTALTGYRGEDPWKCGIAWPDPIGGLHGAAGALIGLLDRFVEPDLGGQTVEVAQVESAINMIGQHVVAAQTNGNPQRWGNRRPGRAPQGVYPCAGLDRWIAISIIDDDGWRALCAFAGWDDAAGLDSRSRWERHDELDEWISALTAEADDIELMRQLQAVGVPAGACLGADEVMADPQLDAVEFFVELDHPDAGTHPWPRFPVRLSATPATMRLPAPTMGEHNHYVATELAGISSQRYQDLVEAGILRTDPSA
ncbi:MAG: CoA transferase [Actinomycetia bacterium]|nr:CoA transferase [Actinomycetes bacterium]MCP5033880.1 CoA transferase [Actinomycetes bacterium]